MGCGQIIAEGAFYFAAVAATITWQSGPPPAGAGDVCGGLPCRGACVCGRLLVPMLLYIRWEANLFVVGMMLNYILLNVGTYVLNYHLLDTDFGYPASYLFPAEPAVLIKRNLCNHSRVLGLAFVVLLYVFFYHTKWGYIRLV